MPKNIPALAGAFAPTGAFLATYIITTAFAAIGYMLPEGTSHIDAMQAPQAQRAIEAIGSPTYLLLLALPFLVTTPFSAATIALTARISRQIIGGAWSGVGISRKLLIALSVIAFGYSFFRLNQLGALVPEITSSATHEDNTIKRMVILDDAGFVFFVFAYGINALVPVAALIRYEMQGHKVADLGICLITAALFVVVIFLTLSKAPILILFVMLATTLLVIGGGLRKLILAGTGAAVLFLASGYLISAMPGNYEKTLPIYEMVVDYAQTTLSGATHRMAAGLPFYVEIFSHPEERCGIQGETLRAVLRISPATCILPAKVFSQMYPDVTWVQGFQPAPAHVSAFGELGMAWSFVVAAASGIVLGLLGSVSAARRGPIFVFLSAVSASFAYYLAQLPVVATFLYPYGLVITLLVVVIFALVGRSQQNFISRRHPKTYPADIPIKRMPKEI